MLLIEEELRRIENEARTVQSELTKLGANPANCLEELNVELQRIQSFRHMFSNAFEDIQDRITRFLHQSLNVPTESLFKIVDIYGTDMNIRSQDDQVAAICHLGSGSHLVDCSAAKIGNNGEWCAATLLGPHIITGDGEKLFI